MLIMISLSRLHNPFIPPFTRKGSVLPTYVGSMWHKIEAGQDLLKQIVGLKTQPQERVPPELHIAVHQFLLQHQRTAAPVPASITFTNRRQYLWSGSSSVDMDNMYFIKVDPTDMRMWTKNM